MGKCWWGACIFLNGCNGKMARSKNLSGKTVYISAICLEKYYTFQPQNVWNVWKTDSQNPVGTLQKCIDPRQDFVVDSIRFHFNIQSFVWNGVESFGEIEIDTIYNATIRNYFCTAVEIVQKLSNGGPSANKPKLFLGYEIVFDQMS